jgi:hypothetical protein
MLNTAPASVFSNLSSKLILLMFDQNFPEGRQKATQRERMYLHRLLMKNFKELE